ncbi:unnamed protein product [Mytilus edulis]|uniref:Uncharacterized protein n=1 Tax=Mytilus edulis TaxID=6550 RepID=A0A8S3UFW8_MYTED|nr:unnamed protein product [Mytilus edulis]
MNIFILILIVQVIAPPARRTVKLEVGELCRYERQGVLRCGYVGEKTYILEPQIEVSTLIMDRLFESSTLEIINKDGVTVRINNGEMEWCCYSIKGATAVFVADKQCPTTVKTPSLMTDYTSMVQPTRTTTLPASETKNTLAFSSTTSTMTTELKNMTAGTIINNLEGWVIPTVSTLCEYILAVVMIIVATIEIIRKFRIRLQNLLHRLENPTAQQDDQLQAALPPQDQPIAPLPAQIQPQPVQNQPQLAQNQPQPAENQPQPLRRSQRQITPVMRLNLYYKAMTTTYIIKFRGSKKEWNRLLESSHPSTEEYNYYKQELKIATFERTKEMVEMIEGRGVEFILIHPDPYPSPEEETRRREEEKTRKSEEKITNTNAD